MTLDEMKKMYPAYRDMGEEELGKAVYDKYYKGKVDEETFWQKVRSGPGKAIDVARKAVPRFADVAATLVSGVATEPVAKTVGIINLLHGESWGSPEEAFGSKEVKEKAEKGRMEYARQAESDVRNLLQYEPRYEETTNKALEIMGKKDPAQRMLGGAIETSERLATNLLGKRAGYGVGAAATVAPFLIGGEGGVRGTTIKGVGGRGGGPRPAIRFLDGKKEVVKGKEGTPHVNVYDKLKAGQEDRPMETGWWVDGKFEKNMGREEISKLVEEANMEREKMRKKAEEEAIRETEGKKAVEETEGVDRREEVTYVGEQENPYGKPITLVNNKEGSTVTFNPETMKIKENVGELNLIKGKGKWWPIKGMEVEDVSVGGVKKKSHSNSWGRKTQIQKVG